MLISAYYDFQKHLYACWELGAFENSIKHLSSLLGA